MGIPLAAGGPYVGLVGTREELVDYLPGRLVGETTDIKGETALALIKQEREQHVRRHEATSHICSNQALLAIRALVYLSLMGETGLKRIATLNAQKLTYRCEQLCALDGVRRVYSGTFFNEFLLEIPVESEALIAALRAEGFHAGIRMDDHHPCQILIAVTETKSRTTLDNFAQAFARSIQDS